MSSVKALNMLLTSSYGLCLTAFMLLTTTVKLPNGKAVLMDRKDYEALPSQKIILSNSYPCFPLRKEETVNGTQVIWRASVLVHRWIMRCPKDKVVDHINRNPLDARRSNLRVCTQVQNILNRDLLRSNTSGFRGVHARKVKNQVGTHYDVSVKSRKLKGTYFGSFTNIKVAARVYDREAQKLYGAFASLNFPNEDNRNYVPPAKYVVDKRRAKSGKVGVYTSPNGTFYVQAPTGSGRNSTIGSGFTDKEAAYAFRLDYLKEKGLLSPV